MAMNKVDRQISSIGNGGLILVFLPKFVGIYGPNLTHNHSQLVQSWSIFFGGLLLLKIYPKESAACSLVGGYDKQRWREWSWFFVDAIFQLEFVW